MADVNITVQAATPANVTVTQPPSPTVSAQQGSFLGIADGSLTPAKLSTGKPNWDTSGNLTATSFVGPITGAVTGNVTGAVTGNVTGNVTGAGNSTFAGNIGIGTSSPIRKLHLANTSSVEQIWEQTDALTDYRKYNSVVQSGSASVGATYLFRILNDAGSAATKNIYAITPDGKIDTQGNPITNCKTTAKAWVNFNGTETSIGSSGNAGLGTSIVVTSGSSAGVWNITGAAASYVGEIYLIPSIGGVANATLGGVVVATGGFQITAVNNSSQYAIKLINGPATSNQTISGNGTSTGFQIIVTAIRSSYNVSSVTKSATGVYAVNMISMPDTTYSVVGAVANTPSGAIVFSINESGTPRTATQFGVAVYNAAFSSVDTSNAQFAVFGN